MKRTEAVAGALLAVALAGGVLFAKLRDRPVSAGNRPEVDADISAADGRMKLDGVVVDVLVEPRPAHPFESLRFRFRFTRDDAPVEIMSARVSFSMTMDMGPHNYELLRDGADWIATDVVLPKCGSGSRLWFGDLAFRDATGRDFNGRFEINLAP